MRNFISNPITYLMRGSHHIVIPNMYRVRYILDYIKVGLNYHYCSIVICTIVPLYHCLLYCSLSYHYTIIPLYCCLSYHYTIIYFTVLYHTIILLFIIPLYHCLLYCCLSYHCLFYHCSIFPSYHTSHCSIVLLFYWFITDLDIPILVLVGSVHAVCYRGNKTESIWVIIFVVVFHILI